MGGGAAVKTRHNSWELWKRGMAAVDGRKWRRGRLASGKEVGEPPIPKGAAGSSRLGGGVAEAGSGVLAAVILIRRTTAGS